jgi:hypothetical protein
MSIFKYHSKVIFLKYNYKNALWNSWLIETLAIQIKQ